MFVVALSTQDKTKPLQQLKSEFKGIINWGKYQSQFKHYTQKYCYLNCLIDQSFHGSNRLYMFSFENETGSREHTR